MYYETYEKLKQYAAIHPDKVAFLTKKELDSMEIKEGRVCNNECCNDNNTFSSPNITVHI